MSTKATTANYTAFAAGTCTHIKCAFSRHKLKQIIVERTRNVRARHLRHVAAIALFAYFQQDTTHKQTNKRINEPRMRREKKVPKRYLLRRISFWNYDVVADVVVISIAAADFMIIFISFVRARK